MKVGYKRNIFVLVTLTYIFHGLPEGCRVFWCSMYLDVVLDNIGLDGVTHVLDDKGCWKKNGASYFLRASELLNFVSGDRHKNFNSPMLSNRDTGKRKL